MKIRVSSIWMWIVVVISGITAIAFHFGAKVPVAEQLGVYSSLITVSSFVFGVMGAWLALVYPETLKNIVDPSYKGKASALKTIRRMLIPMVVSLSVIGSCLAVTLGSIVLKHNFPGAPSVEFFRSVSLGFLVLLCQLVLLSLVYAIAPGIIIVDQFSTHAERQARIERMRSRSP